jgi:hypothetical protein
MSEVGGGELDDLSVFINFNGEKMWNDDNERVLQAWGQKAQYYSVLNEQTAALYSRRDRWFGLPLVILGSITTSTMFIGNDCTNDYKTIISGVLSMCCTMLTAFGKFFAYGELKLQFTHTAQMYDSVVLDIQEQLSRPRAEREDAHTFMATIKSTLSQLKKSAEIPHTVFKKYIADVDKHLEHMGIDIHVPESVPNAVPTDVTHTYPEAILLQIKQETNPDKEHSLYRQTGGLDSTIDQSMGTRVQAYQNFFA